MPEEQNVVATEWNSRLNSFLNGVLHWSQLGESNNDIYCEALKRKVGIDSVFAYKRNQATNQQIVFVEAKTIDTVNGLSRSKIEGWVTDFVEKINCAPNSTEFAEKYQPDPDANYHLGVIALWVRDLAGYSDEKIRTWLSQLNLPVRRQNPINIVFISNRIISSICSVHQTIQNLKPQDDYSAIKYYFPIYGDLPVADGNCIPAETLLSKFLFCKATRKQSLKGTKQINEYESSLVFYTGLIENYDDLRFVGLALKQFQILASANQDIEIYTCYPDVEIRNESRVFKEEFAETGCSFNFHELSVSDEIPGWLKA